MAKKLNVEVAVRLSAASTNKKSFHIPGSSRALASFLETESTQNSRWPRIVAEVVSDVAGIARSTIGRLWLGEEGKRRVGKWRGGGVGGVG